MADYDISLFEGQMSWSKRYDEIKRAFPSVESLDWNNVFRSDPTILGNIINDVLKIDQAQPGRPGKRPALNIEQAESRLRNIRGEDYTTLPFHEALQAMGQSIRSLSATTGIPKTEIHRLRNGEKKPTIDQIEQVAEGIKKHPSFFIEYRIGFVVHTLSEMMMVVPESTIVQYEKMRDMKK